MMRTYVTFGQIHAHSIGGKTFDKDCVAVVYHNKPDEGRTMANSFFGQKFSTSYSQEQYEKVPDMMKFYPRGQIDVNKPSN